MKPLDLDRAFPQTPDCIHAAIELGLRKGKNKMKFRNKMIAMGGIAAALAVMLAAALALGVDRTPRPDVLSQPVLELPAGEEAATVYTTDGAAYYHADEHCSGLQDARSMTEREAVALGKQPCPVCIPLSCSGHEGEIEFVYYSQGGKYFHRQQECSGGEMPLKGRYQTVTEEFPGKEPCPVCFPNGIALCLHGKAFAAQPEPTPTAAPAPEESAEASPLEDMPQAEEYVAIHAGNVQAQAEKGAADADLVYTEYGANPLRYHRLQNCSGGDYRRAIPKEQARKENLQLCEACYDGLVYYTEGGTYYHSDSSCQGMHNATAHDRNDVGRKSPCPTCLNVYCTEDGTYYHLLPNCIGMIGAALRSPAEARALNKQRCPICLSPLTVYATQKGNYFHAFSACSGMEGASPTDPGTAFNSGKTPCPVCIIGEAEGGSTDALSSSLQLSPVQLFQTVFGAEALNGCTVDSQESSTRSGGSERFLLSNAAGLQLQCEVYPSGSVGWAEQVNDGAEGSGLAELVLTRLAGSAEQMEAFLQAAPEPLAGMCADAPQLAQQCMESAGMDVPPTRLPIQSITVYCDANNQLSRCEMVLGDSAGAILRWRRDGQSGMELYGSDCFQNT